MSGAIVHVAVQVSVSPLRVIVVGPAGVGAHTGSGAVRKAA